MTTLNAYDEKVQAFITIHKTESQKNYSNERMQLFKVAEQDKGLIFEATYPKKQYEVVTQLLIMLAQTGITKISAEKLAEKADCSVRTITTVVNKLKKDTQIIVARLKSSSKNNGHYIFVDKNHANFKAIMREVFMLDNSSIAELNAEQIAEQKNAENVDTSMVEDEKNGSKGFKGFKRHTKDINKYISSADKISVVEKIEAEPIKTKDEQQKYIEEYATCLAQKQLFKMIHDIKDMMLPCIIEQSHKIALRIGSNAEWKDVVMARDVLLTITENTKDYVFKDVPNSKTIVATFTERLNYKRTHNVPVATKEVTTVKIAPFYNWLEEKENENG